MSCHKEKEIESEEGAVGQWSGLAFCKFTPTKVRDFTGIVCSGVKQPICIVKDSVCVCGGGLSCQSVFIVTMRRACLMSSHSVSECTFALTHQKTGLFSTRRLGGPQLTFS